MALYRCAVVHEGILPPYEGHTWRNVYTVEAATYDAALAVADVLAGHEQVFHTNKTAAVRVTAHGLFEPTRRTGAQMGISRVGNYDPVGNPWPLWNCIRCEFFDTGLGRPERKYYRVGLHTGMLQASGELLGTYQSIIVPELATMQSLANYVGPSGESHNNFQLDAFVQMRQLGWHRRQRPGFRRGYVAV